MTNLEWLARLVAFDTTSRNSNLALIGVVQEWVTQHGMQSRQTNDKNQQKANLFATLPAANGEINGGIVFSGHTDVVPVDGQAWNTNPFELVQVEDRVYGRGTTDMKGFLAVLLALLPDLQKMQLRQPIHFAFSYDEEVGCLGARLLIQDLQAAKIHPRLCIVGEPTNMQPVIAHKGIQGFHCRVHGLAAHSSLTPNGCNAIEYAAKLISFIRQIADEFKQQGPFEEFYDVPFTTISTNMISGGNAHNTIPVLCEFHFEFRHLACVDPHTIIAKINSYVEKELMPPMQKEYIQAKIEITPMASVPAFESQGIDVSKIMDTTEIRKVAYATEAGLFQHANIPTLVCGPGSIEQAHRANEFILISQLNMCEDFVRRMVNCIG